MFGCGGVRLSVWADEHDWENYPELTSGELASFGFVSPHEQIVSDFEAVVVKVHDGDTFTLRCSFRDFDFPLRLLAVDAPELSTGLRGEEARDFVKDLILGEGVLVKVDRFNRVGKYGRLLGDVVVAGQSLSNLLVSAGFALPFGRRHEGEMLDINKELRVDQWF